MNTRTWPFGTRRRGKVLRREDATYKGKPVVVLVLQDDRGEGHILIDCVPPESPVQAGHVGTLVFTKGGPTGGHWRLENAGPDECPGHERGGVREPCCDRAGQYNGFGSDGPLLFHCPKGCSCHD